MDYSVRPATSQVGEVCGTHKRQKEHYCQKESCKMGSCKECWEAHHGPHCSTDGDH